MGDLDFVCPTCGKEYPTVARTSRGTCMACGFAKKSAIARKGMFLRREKYNKFTSESMRLHKNRLAGNT